MSVSTVVPAGMFPLRPTWVRGRNGRQRLSTLPKVQEDSETRRDSLTHPLVAIRAEQARVVALLHDDVSDAWLIVLLQTDAGLPDGQELIVQHL